MSISPSSSEVKSTSSTITLTKVEADIIDCLLDARKHVDELKGTQIRIAGGWVRDRLMNDVGISSSTDLDLVVDNVSGETFAKALQTYLRGSNSKSSLSGMGVIRANPARSKHLATATFSLHGVQVDVSNLRSEVYAQEVEVEYELGRVERKSRIPKTVCFGTPEQDALRRDLTINSLFFNLETNNVEDWSKRGLADLLDAKLIRTPLCPHQTFADDPLRVLRCARFAGRFAGFTVDAELEKAASSKAVRRQLLDKVSRERIGLEVCKMMDMMPISQQARSPSPFVSISLICKWKLRSVVFQLPEHPMSNEADAEEKQLETRALCILRAMETQLLANSGNNDHHNNNISNRIMLLAAFLSPWFDPTHLVQARTTVEYILRTSLRLACQESSRILSIVEAAHQFVKTATQLQAAAEPMTDAKESTASDPQRQLQLDVGRLLVDGIKQDWSLALDLAKCIGKTTIVNTFRQWLMAESGLIIRLESELDYCGCWQWKPWLEGTQLMNFFHIRPGPDVGKLIMLQRDWRLLHPFDAKSDQNTRRFLEHLGEML